jgi:HD-GYP domain-containing protein (c-di-GMP phosphodiesterase class II)/DNA-binding CsgD family transcriptional regulator
VPRIGQMAYMMSCVVKGTDARLAELLGALSLSCDIAFAFPLEKTIRTCILAVELARQHGLSNDAVRDVYYATLLTYTGCTAFTHEVSLLTGGDDIAVSNAMIFLDLGDPVDMVWQLVKKLDSSRGIAERAGTVARLMVAGKSRSLEHAHSVCDVATDLATLLDMSSGVRAALTEVCERWDGKGSPRGKSGGALLLTMRVVNVAHIAEIAHHRGGRECALAVLKKRAGGQLDPAMAKTFARESEALFGAIERESVWDHFLEAEPEPHATANPARFDDVALAFARVADLKSVWTLGHSPGVAHLADAAAQAVGLPDGECRLLHRAALLHDLGRLSASNRVWDKPGKLSTSEWELVRMHAYWTERVLSRSGLLRDAAVVASAAHERLDATGYHRAVSSAALNGPARILAAADAYHAMREPRAHRPALDANQVAEILVGEVAAGRLDREAVTALLDVVGARSRPAPAAWPRGLTDREVEVLRLLARGGSTKEIASALRISPRTAQHHVIHIYQKIERNSRAGAALFATEHGLLDPA